MLLELLHQVSSVVDVVGGMAGLSGMAQELAFVVLAVLVLFAGLQWFVAWRR